MEFIKRNIPFKVIGGHRFLEKRHIRDIIAYIKILWNPFDAISWHRILTLLQGIGPVTAYNIVDYIKSKDGDLTELINNSYVKKNENFKLLCYALKEANQSNFSIIDIFNTMEKYYILFLKNLSQIGKNGLKILTLLKQCLQNIEVLKIFFQILF